MNIKTSLEAEIQAELESLRGLEEMDPDAYKTTVEGLTKLLDRNIEMEKVEVDKNHKEQTMKAEKRDRIVKNSLTALGLVATTAVTIWGTLATFKFEESGTVTTIVGRGFINKLLPKNKN